MKLAVFVSGQGTLLQKLIDSGKHEILYVAGDRICPAIEKAVKAGIPVCRHDKVEELPKPELNVLAGFITKANLGPEPNTFINVHPALHPALLPAFGGKDMYEWKVFSEIKQSQTNFTGCTVHFCNEQYDEGAIILQKCVRVDPGWSDKNIAEATHKLELPCLLASLEAIEHCRDVKFGGTYLDYIRAVHKYATEVDIDNAEQAAWARVGRRALVQTFKDDEMIDKETKRCATVAEEMERYDIAAIIRGEMEIGDDLISEKGDC